MYNFAFGKISLIKPIQKKLDGFLSTIIFLSVNLILSNLLPKKFEIFNK